MLSPSDRSAAPGVPGASCATRRRRPVTEREAWLSAARAQAGGQASSQVPELTPTEESLWAAIREIRAEIGAIREEVSNKVAREASERATADSGTAFYLQRAMEAIEQERRVRDSQLKEVRLYGEQQVATCRELLAHVESRLQGQLQMVVQDFKECSENPMRGSLLASMQSRDLPVEGAQLQQGLHMPMVHTKASGLEDMRGRSRGHSQNQKGRGRSTVSSTPRRGHSLVVRTPSTSPSPRNSTMQQRPVQLLPGTEAAPPAPGVVNPANGQPPSILWVTPSQSILVYTDKRRSSFDQSCTDSEISQREGQRESWPLVHTPSGSETWQQGGSASISQGVGQSGSSGGGSLAAADTMKAQLQALQLEDPGTIFIARRINKLGFASAELLRMYFAHYGQVKGVYVSHSRVKSLRGGNKRWPANAQWRLRAAALGFVVMGGADAAQRILCEGPEHIINGVPVRVHAFHSRHMELEEEDMCLDEC